MRYNRQAGTAEKSRYVNFGGEGLWKGGMMPGAAGTSVWVGQGMSEHPHGRERGNTLKPTASAHVMELYGNDRITCCVA